MHPGRQGCELVWIRNDAYYWTVGQAEYIELNE
jgi:hypothetical protein